jgi:hypothetical protein
MSRFLTACTALALAALVPGTAVRAHDDDRTRQLAIVMTNDATANEIKVYDTQSHALLQTLSTHGRGGVGGNARGVRQYDGRIVAVVNFGSGTVAVFKRVGNRLRFDGTVATTSNPVSIDFGNDHMYVAGESTVDSFVLRHGGVERLDGTTTLALAGGGAPPPGSTAQVGVINRRQLLVTLKTDPTPGTVDVVTLDDGEVTGATPDAVSAPAGTLTPFGFSVYDDGTAIITLAHSNHDGLFRDGAFAAVAAAGQMAPCWTTAIGKYVFTANTASRTISRVIGTGSHLFIDNAVAATIPTGAPSDLDAAGGVMGVIDRAAGQSHLTLLSYNQFGELTPSGAVINVGAPNANGVAIVASTDGDDD